MYAIVSSRAISHVNYGTLIIAGATGGRPPTWKTDDTDMSRASQDVQLATRWVVDVGRCGYCRWYLVYRSTRLTHHYPPTTPSAWAILHHTYKKEEPSTLLLNKLRMTVSSAALTSGWKFDTVTTWLIWRHVIFGKNHKMFFSKTNNVAYTFTSRVYEIAYNSLFYAFTLYYAWRLLKNMFTLQ